MTRRLFDMRMADGSRHFGGLPETYDVDSPQWYALRDRVGLLPDAKLTGFITDDVTEAWIDFSFAGQSFSLNNQHGQWWFFVDDPTCPDPLLDAVLDHFEALLAPISLHARRAGPVEPGCFRAVVLEADGRIACKDFREEGAARRYADDAASEAEAAPVSAYVVDENLQTIYAGTHY